MPKAKATKKFEKNRLKDVLKTRKEFSKIKQRHQVNDKKKARKAREQGKEQDDDSKSAKEGPEGHQFEHMNVDEFFQGGFEIPEDPKAPRKKKSKDAPANTNKRKRTENEDDVDPSAQLGKEHPDLDGSVSEAESEGSEMHEDQLKALKDKDPEFYKYLQENDAELLDFEDGDLKEIDALSEDEEKLKAKKKKGKRKEEKQSDEESEGNADNEVTKAMAAKWESALIERHSLRAMKEVVLAFRAAAHLNEEDGKTYKYSVSSSEVYHKLLMIALKHVPEVLQHHLPVKGSSNGKVSVAMDSKKFRTLTPLLKSHITSIHHLLQSLSDAATLRLTLTSIIPLLPYILSFKKAIGDLVKTVVIIWSSPSSTEATRIAAFLILRRLVVIGDLGIKESVLKATYQGLVKGSRSTTTHTIKGVNLMKNSAAELWGLDRNVGYTTGFTFIRQLAIHLRSSITNPTKDSYKVVYNWQYVHSLDFWSRVLAEHCSSLKEAETGKESPLRPLIYPTVQVTMGAMRLIPTSQYFPLRFQLVRSLLRISRATTTYIPLAPALFEVLSSKEMKKSPKPATMKPLDFSTNIRAPKAYLKTRIYQDGVGEQVVELLSEFFVLWCKNIAFPELALPVLVMLKRWLKETSDRSTGNKNGKVNSSLILLVQKLELNSRWIVEKREKVEFAPNDRSGVEGFLKDVAWEKTPLGAFVVGQRMSREEKEKVLEAGRKAEENKRRARGEGNDDEAPNKGGGEFDEDVESGDEDVEVNDED